MKATINGKRYDTEKCEVLGEYDHKSSSGNYSGTTHLLKASDGTLLVWTDTNGQDGYLRDCFRAWADYDGGDTIDHYNLTEEQEARCAGLGLIEIVD